MEELDINTSLLKENLFELFKAQLKKDFESAGVNAGFTEQLPCDFEAMRQIIIAELEPMLKTGGTLVSSLLYRIDISEMQLRNYQDSHPDLSFPETLAELIIKRILQKVILKKTYSNRG